MLTVKRFSSFDEAKPAWESLETQPDVYPFQQLWYLELFAKHFSHMDDVYLLGVYKGDAVVAVGGFEKIGETLLFLGMKPVLGKEEVTDYGDILLNSEFHNRTDEVWQIIREHAGSLGAKTLRLDYVRHDSQSLITLKDTVKVKPQEVAPYLELPPSWDEYLAMLPRVERKELKRKFRRLATQEGVTYCLNTHGENDFEEFIRLHRLSDPKKNQFMSEAMKAFFHDINRASKPIWQTDFCFIEVGGKKVSGVMTFVSEEQVLLYNSGFDPEYAYYAVGLLLKAHLIEEAIKHEKKCYDTLRGNERYKYDLGAKDLQLWQIPISL